MDGKLVQYADDIHSGDSFVAASNENFKNCDYGIFSPHLKKVNQK